MWWVRWALCEPSGSIVHNKTVLRSWVEAKVTGLMDGCSRIRYAYLARHWTVAESGG